MSGLLGRDSERVIVGSYKFRSVHKVVYYSDVDTRFRSLPGSRLPTLPLSRPTTVESKSPPSQEDSPEVFSPAGGSIGGYSSVCRIRLWWRWGVSNSLSVLFCIQRNYNDEHSIADVILSGNAFLRIGISNQDLFSAFSTVASSSGVLYAAFKQLGGFDGDSFNPLLTCPRMPGGHSRCCVLAHHGRSSRYRLRRFLDLRERPQQPSANTRRVLDGQPVVGNGSGSCGWCLGNVRRSSLAVSSIQPRRPTDRPLPISSNCRSQLLYHLALHHRSAHASVAPGLMRSPANPPGYGASNW